MNKIVNATVNAEGRAIIAKAQAVENVWRRVPESNRSTRICKE
jgi:hypothetical protein